jgi:ribosomal protein S18 acetylase RimI-like enzyme
MVAESLHDLAQEGAALAETHVAEGNEAALGLFTKLGFETTARGTVFRKP